MQVAAAAQQKPTQKLEALLELEQQKTWGHPPCDTRAAGVRHQPALQQGWTPSPQAALEPVFHLSLLLLHPGAALQRFSCISTCDARSQPTEQGCLQLLQPPRQSRSPPSLMHPSSLVQLHPPLTAAISSFHLDGVQRTCREGREGKGRDRRTQDARRGQEMCGEGTLEAQLDPPKQQAKKEMQGWKIPLHN